MHSTMHLMRIVINSISLIGQRNFLLRASCRAIMHQCSHMEQLERERLTRCSVLKTRLGSWCSRSMNFSVLLTITNRRGTINSKSVTWRFTMRTSEIYCLPFHRIQTNILTSGRTRSREFVFQELQRSWPQTSTKSTSTSDRATVSEPRKGQTQMRPVQEVMLFFKSQLSTKIRLTESVLRSISPSYH